jgi:hypothetical protein
MDAGQVKEGLIGQIACVAAVSPDWAKTVDTQRLKSMKSARQAILKRISRTAP